jgi:hypothetical protein
MIPSSDLFQASMAYSRTMFAEMDIVYGGTVLENDVPLTSGSVTTDRTRNTRYEATVEIGMYPWDSLPITSQGTRIRIRRGVESIGVRESVQVGEYQVYDYKRTNRGTVSTTLKGLENYLIEATFIRPIAPPYGASILGTISDLIHDVLPDVDIVVQVSTDRLVSATGAWEQDRWGDAISSLAAGINAEVYAGYDGRFYIVDTPDMNNLVGQYQIAGGPGGVLISEDRSDTRDGVYNGVSVSTNSSDQTVPPLWAFAYDNNPDSPTYFYGPYGQRVRYYSSQFFTSVVQCQGYANQLLFESLAPNQSLSIGTVPIPFLESGDPVTVVSQQDYPTGTYLINKTTLPLGSGSWSADLLAAGTDITVGEGSA